MSGAGYSPNERRVRDLAGPGEAVRCEAIRFCDDTRCPHPARYLAPYDSSAVCGVHARGFLHCIPIAEIEGSSQGTQR